MMANVKLNYRHDYKIVNGNVNVLSIHIVIENNKNNKIFTEKKIIKTIEKYKDDTNSTCQNHRKTLQSRITQQYEKKEK